MQLTTIAQRVHRVFGRTVIIEGDEADDLQLANDLLLDDDLGYDSLGVMGIVVDLEEEFGIEIDDDAMEAWRTVGDVIKTVQGLVS